MEENNPRDWHKRLSKALWVDRTSKKKAIGITPFALTYGRDAVLLVEINVQSLRLERLPRIDAVFPAFLPFAPTLAATWPPRFLAANLPALALSRCQHDLYDAPPKSFSPMPILSLILEAFQILEKKHHFLNLQSLGKTYVVLDICPISQYKMANSKEIIHNNQKGKNVTLDT